MKLTVDVVILKDHLPLTTHFYLQHRYVPNKHLGIRSYPLLQERVLTLGLCCR